MKKIISALLLLTLTLFAFTACSSNSELDIGVLNGPTGMGMAKLMHDDIDAYDFEQYSDPTAATSDLTNGDIDLLCLPTNTAANLYKKSGGLIQVLAINCLGSLYLMTDENTKISSVADLEGKTIYASVPSSTTGPIIQYILKANNVNATVEFEPTHDALVKRVKDGDASIVVLPEPKATAALNQAKTYEIDLNLSEEWDKISDEPLTMGCIVARTDFIKNNKSAINKFLSRYEKSIKFIGNEENHTESANMIFEQEIIPALPIAKSSLTNLYGSIVYIDGEEMKSALEGFYEAISMELPDENFYYNAN